MPKDTDSKETSRTVEVVVRFKIAVTGKNAAVAPLEALRLAARMVSIDEREAGQQTADVECEGVKDTWTFETATKAFECCNPDVADYLNSYGV